MPPVTLHEMEIDFGRKKTFLCEDIVEHKILPLLPCSSLYKFKCVSRRWNHVIISHNLISIPNYLLAGCLTYPELILFAEDQNHPSIDLDGLPPGSFQFPVSSNGLFCFMYGRSYDFCVLNPATGERSIIPNPNRRSLIGLAFDPLNPTPRYDLVCPFPAYGDPWFRISSYQLRCTKWELSTREYIFEVFSSETAAWRVSTAKLQGPLEFCSFEREAVFAGGILYWATKTHIVWFEVGKDKAGCIAWPTSRAEPLTKRVIGEFHGRLTLTQLCIRKIKVWMMREFCWKKMYSWKFDELFGQTMQKTVGIFHRREDLKRMAHQGLHFPRREVYPLPFAGGNIWFLVEGRVFGYDVRAGKLVKYGRCTYLHFEKRWFIYRKTSVSLPKLASL